MHKCTVVLKCFAYQSQNLYTKNYISLFIVLILIVVLCDDLKKYCKVPKNECLRNFLLLICIFVYFSEQILFPPLLLICFCVLNLKYVGKIEDVKFSLKDGIYREISLPEQSFIHRNLLQKIKKHKETFSFLMFLILCLMIAMGFTGLASLM